MSDSNPNVRYVGDCLIAELKQVKRPDYLTNVSEVDWAPFDFGDEMVVTRATIGPVFFIWLQLEEEEGMTGGLGGSRDWLDVTYGITGALCSVDPQTELVNMAVDLRRVVRQNPNRLYPGEIGGTDYCKFSRLRRVEYHFGMASDSMGYGTFDALVTCTVGFPHATG